MGNIETGPHVVSLAPGDIALRRKRDKEAGTTYGKSKKKGSWGGNTGICMLKYM